MVLQETLDALEGHGVPIMRSAGSAGIELSELMCVIQCEISLQPGGGSPKVGFPRAIVLTLDEAVAVMDTGLAGQEPARVSMERWARLGRLVYHNFLLRPDGSLIMDTMSGAELIVGESGKEQAYAVSLVQALSFALAGEGEGDDAPLADPFGAGGAAATRH